MITYAIELKCCRRPWGLFSSPREAMDQVQSVIRCHEAYYKSKKCATHKTVVVVTCKPAVTWSDIYSGRA